MYWLPNSFNAVFRLSGPVMTLSQQNGNFYTMHKRIPYQGIKENITNNINNTISSFEHKNIFTDRTGNDVTRSFYLLISLISQHCTVKPTDTLVSTQTYMDFTVNVYARVCT